VRDMYFHSSKNISNDGWNICLCYNSAELFRMS
jgi:hypothetical protein